MASGKHNSVHILSLVSHILHFLGNDVVEVVDAVFVEHAHFHATHSTADRIVDFLSSSAALFDDGLLVVDAAVGGASGSVLELILGVLLVVI